MASCPGSGVPAQVIIIIMGVGVLPITLDISISDLASVSSRNI